MGAEYEYLKEDLYSYILMTGISDVMGLKVDVCGIISTDYKTKYKDLIDTYNQSSDQFSTHEDYDKYCLEVKNYYSVLFAKSTAFINSVNVNIGYTKVSSIKFRPTFGEYKKGLPSTKYVYKLEELTNQLTAMGHDIQSLKDNNILSQEADTYINDSSIKNAVIIPLNTYKEMLEQFILKMEEDLEETEDAAKRQALTEAEQLLGSLSANNYHFDPNSIKDYQKINMGTFNFMDMADGPVYEEYLNVVGIIDFNGLATLIPATASYGSIVCAIFSDENVIKNAAANNSLKAIYVTLPDSERLVREYLTIANNNYVYHESEISATLYLVSNIFKIFSIVFQWVALIMGIFSTILLFNFVTISVVNKQKEIGILRAIGAKGGDVGKIFLIESTIMGAITVVCSWGLIFIGTHLINNLLVSSFKSYLQSTIINRITLLTVGFTPIFAVLIACAIVVLLATIIPVIKISRMKPVDAIKKL
jgi:ABC-type antimicrobial peptide transport system permease subunit